jgi:hypothetical protein
MRNDEGTGTKIVISDNFKGIFIRCNGQHVGLVGQGDFHCSEEFTTWVERGYMYIDVTKGY